MEPIVIGLLVAAGIVLVVYVRRRRARLRHLRARLQLEDIRAG